jgi:hypothetical protein
MVYVMAKSVCSICSSRLGMYYSIIRTYHIHSSDTCTRLCQVDRIPDGVIMGREAVPVQVHFWVGALAGPGDSDSEVRLNRDSDLKFRFNLPVTMNPDRLGILSWASADSAWSGLSLAADKLETWSSLAGPGSWATANLKFNRYESSLVRRERLCTALRLSRRAAWVTSSPCRPARRQPRALWAAAAAIAGLGSQPHWVTVISNHVHNSDTYVTYKNQKV